jgi:FMN phosphatase YigB (HAD superfamily)
MMLTKKLNKPQLVLDIAGVLMSNLSPLFWEELALHAHVPYAVLKAQFKQDIRQKLWSGQLSEPAFWLWLNKQCPSLEFSEAKNMLFKNLYPLPAIKWLDSWSQIANIHLLSNNGLEWLTHFISSVQPFVKSITISSEAGLCKPDLQIYQHVQQQMQNTHKVLFVETAVQPK